MAKQIIELNGKRYDMETGRLIAEGVAPTRSVDGFAPKDKPYVSLAKKKPSGKRDIKVRFVSSSSQVHFRPSRSITLMRSAVKKPAKPSHSISHTKKPSHKIVDKERLERAAGVSRSEHISKFHQAEDNSSSEFKRRSRPVTVHFPEGEPRFLPHAKDPRPHFARGDNRIFANILEHAIAAATAHQAQPLKLPKKNSRTFSWASAAIAVLLLAGFIAYQNVHQVGMRLAANRAGISASLPAYKPDGFSITDKISYSPGQVTVSFQANADDREYAVSQQATAWTEEDLLSNFVKNSEEDYQTHQQAGTNVFLFGNSNATWIKDGIWYSIQGNSKLTSEQLLRIAASM